MPDLMRTRRPRRSRALVLVAALAVAAGCSHATASRGAEPAFRVLAFFTGKQDQAHISFLGEAVRWFPKQASAHGFAFDTTSDWSRMNDSALAPYHAPSPSARCRCSVSAWDISSWG